MKKSYLSRVRKESKKSLLTLPKVSQGYRRAFYKCKNCGAPMYRDFVPYSLSNPLLSLPCGCLIVSHPSNHIETVTEEQAVSLFKKEYEKVVVEM